MNTNKRTEIANKLKVIEHEGFDVKILHYKRTKRIVTENCREPNDIGFVSAIMKKIKNSGIKGLESFFDEIELFRDCVNDEGWSTFVKNIMVNGTHLIALEFSLKGFVRKMMIQKSFWFNENHFSAKDVVNFPDWQHYRKMAKAETDYTYFFKTYLAGTDYYDIAICPHIPPVFGDFTSFIKKEFPRLPFFTVNNKLITAENIHKILIKYIGIISGVALDDELFSIDDFRDID